MRSTFRPALVWLAALLTAWAFSALQALTGTEVPLIGIGVLCVLACLWLLPKRTARARMWLWLLLGAAAGLVFILMEPHAFSRHDLAHYEVGQNGHLGYIAYIAKKGTLPLANETEQLNIYYNPPLYHLLQAAFMRLNLLLGFEEGAALENLQAITYAFAMLAPMTAVQIAGELGADEKGKSLCALVAAFAPIGLILGATLTSDSMVCALLLLTIWRMLIWIRTREMRHIVWMGLCLGCAMATKLNAALMIPPMALVFIVLFFREKENRKRLFGQYAAFLGVSVPEAVAWPLYHLLACGMPLSYVPLPSESQNVSSYSLWQRFGIPGNQVLHSLFHTKDRAVTHNVWMETLKTGIFDEVVLFDEGTPIWYISYLWMVLFAVLLVVMTILFIRMMLKRAPGQRLPGIFLLTYGVIIFAYYLKFCVDYPYTCTYNFRYIEPLMFLGCIALSWGRGHLKRSSWLVTLCGCFAGLCVLVWGMYFFGSSLYMG